MLNKANLTDRLKELQESGVIKFCTKEYRNGYDGFDKRQFYAPFYIEFLNGEGWLLFTSNSIRSDRMNNQQWSSLHLKKISSNITRSYLVIPDEISLNEREASIAKAYQKKITTTMYSTIEDVCYQCEIIQMIKNHAIQTGKEYSPMKKIQQNSNLNCLAAESDFDFF